MKHGADSQLRHMEVEGRRVLRYSQDTAKNHQGGLKDYGKARKVVDAYENLSNPDRCPVRIYEEYLRLCPQPLDSLKAFYLRPLSKPTQDVWFSHSPVGRHTLADTVASICREGGLSGYRTNHSLRSSAATRLYDAEVDEQLIQEITGHRSNDVRGYKRTSEAKKQKISAIIQLFKMVHRPIPVNINPLPPVFAMVFL